MNEMSPTSQDARKPGPRSVPISDLSRKLDELCKASGRNLDWVATCLSCTPPAVTHWRQVGRMPPDRLLALCALFGVDQALLLTENLGQFLAGIEERYSLGSGRRWAALLAHRLEADSPGLSLEISGSKPDDDTPRRRGIRTTVRPTERHQFPTVWTTQRLRFRLNAPMLPAGIEWRSDNVLLVVEDPRQQVGCLCPSRLHPTFAVEEAAWMLPSATGQPLIYEDPAGLHRAIAVASAEPFPVDIVDDLRRWEDGPRTQIALDRLALWLRGPDSDAGRSNIRHVVWSLRFVVRHAAPTP